jgi:hypothetical protein
VVVGQREHERHRARCAGYGEREAPRISHAARA